MTRTWTRTGTFALGAVVLLTGPSAALAGSSTPAPASPRSSTTPVGPPPAGPQLGTAPAGVIEIALPDRTPGRRQPVTA